LRPQPSDPTIDQNEQNARIDCFGGVIMAAPSGSESLHDETYLPREDAAEIIDFLSALRDRGRQGADPRPRLTGPHGRSVELPEPMFEVLLQVAAAMKAGLAATVAPRHLTLSTQEAADLLRISRTTLVRLLEAGAIPFEKPSRHRKVLQALFDQAQPGDPAARPATPDQLRDRLRQATGIALRPWQH
jgi:excisionase family DNA binding protein